MFVGKLSLLEDKIDSKLHMQLVDLAQTFTRNKDLVVEPAFHSHYDAAGRLTISQFWHDLTNELREAGMKSDVYLRSIGSAWHTDQDAVDMYLRSYSTRPLSKLGNELIALCEDVRLERICKALRPGTVRIFELRKKAYGAYFKHKLLSHLTKKESADALFIMIYEWLSGMEIAQSAEMSTGAWASYNELLHILHGLYPLLEQVEGSVSTEEISRLCHEMMDRVSYVLERDAITSYFSVELQLVGQRPGTTAVIDELKRVNPLANDDVLQQEEERQAGAKERMPTWHRESADSSPGLLRFELERGSRTAALGSALREGDAADQALAQVQARSRSTERKPSRGNWHAPRLDPGEPAAGEGTGAVGAVPTAEWLAPAKPTAEQESLYRRQAALVAPLAKRLRRGIRRTLEQKRTAPRGELLVGRLGKKLTRIATEEAPRLFVKKQNPAPQLDAAFTLLVDCSASMYDKMEETKLGLVLFHESLKPLRIPHEVVGFWEDADRVTEETAPNLFQVVIDYASSCVPHSGPALLQLEPQQDNRDGFAIRLMTQRLLRRSERQRVLLVFSDGEPSAANYNEAGILDTYEAVLQARRLGLEIISVFLAGGPVHDTQRQTMKNMYGRHSIVVPNIEELPQLLVPILRKLLLKSIF